MGRREDFAALMRHEQPSRLMMDFGGCPLSTMEGQSMYHLLDFLGYDYEKPTAPLLFGCAQRVDERILRHYDTDTRAIGYIFSPPSSLFCRHSETEYTDEWGIRRRFTGLYWEAVNAPLRDASLNDLEHFRWPDPDSIPEQEFEAVAEQARALSQGTDYVICAEHPVYGIFELGCWMCGFDDFLTKMLTEPEFVHAFFTHILAYQKKILSRYYAKIGKYIHYTTSGDDFATQTSTFFSPQLFQELIQPYFSQRIRHTKAYTDAAFLHHSCGNVHALIPLLRESGVEILNPIQPCAEAMQPQCLKSAFGTSIVFHGGIDTQSILPFGTPDSIARSVRETVSVMNRDGGYIFAAAHNIQPDVPPANLDCMLKTARTLELSSEGDTL